MAETSVLKLQQQLSSSGANDMRQKQELTDVVLVCGNRSFPCHRVILSAGSSFFRCMFLSKMEESTKSEVGLRGMDPGALSVVIDVLYGQPFQVDKNKRRDLQSLIVASHMLQVYPLYEHCCHEYLQLLSPDYFVEIWNTAETFQHPNMLQMIPGMLAKNFRRVQRSTDFLLLSSNQMKQLTSQASRQGVDADSIVQGLLAWVKRDVTRRQEHLAPLFANVDLASLSPTFLSKLFMTESLIKTSLELMSSLMAVATSRMVLTQSEQIATRSETIPRNRDLKVLFVSRVNDKAAMQYFDTETNEWSIVMNMPFNLTGLHDAPMTAAYVQKKLYILGGSDMLVYTPFTTRLDTVKSVPPYPAKSAWASVLNGKIYYAGGVGADGKIQRYVQCYDPTLGEWEMKAPTHNEFCHPNMVALGDHLYVVDSQNLIIERYEESSNRWITISTPEVNKNEECLNYWQAPLAPCCNQLFVYDRRSILRSYDPVRNAWKVCECAMEGVIKGMWGASTTQVQLPYLLILGDDGVFYKYHPNSETIEPIPGRMEFIGKGWTDVLLV